MAEPFVFHFKRDDRGFPNLMTIADVKGVCGLCQHDEIQRFYRAVEFHSMTVGGLAELVDEVPSWTGYECANCGTDVGPEHVVASTFVWGFADDAGLIRAYGTGADARWELVPARRLDPQELPGFEAPENALEVLDEELVEDALERPFSIKLAIREFVEEVRDEEEPAWAPLGEGMWVYSELSVPEMDPKMADAHLVRIALDDAAPIDLPTLPDPVAMPGRIETWLGPELWEFIDNGTIRVFIDRRVIRTIFERAFDVARLDFDGDEHGVRNIQTPRETTYDHTVDYADVARRAVYTGISPGEAARLTAEEIVGELLNIKTRKR